MISKSKGTKPECKITKRLKITPKKSKSSTTTKRLKGGKQETDNPDNPDKQGRYDVVVPINLNIVDDNEYFLSPLEQISIQIPPSKEIVKNKDIATTKTYQFWKNCNIDENYMNSNYAVLIMTQDVLLFRGMKTPCDLIYDPHSSRDIYQQLPSWYSDFETANSYANNQVWAYKPIRPLILFELTDMCNVTSLYHHIFNLCEREYKLLEIYDKYKELFDNLNISNNIQKAISELLCCLKMFPSKTLYANDAITECQNIINLDIKKLSQSDIDSSNMFYVCSSISSLLMKSNAQINKYNKSLEVLCAATGIYCTIKEQFRYINHEKIIPEMIKNGEGWRRDNDIEVMNRVSEQTNDFKLVEILREHLPFVDGYYGREIRSTYHEIFHREICIFGSHGKLKLIRDIPLCTSQVTNTKKISNCPIDSSNSVSITSLQREWSVNSDASLDRPPTPTMRGGISNTNSKTNSNTRIRNSSQKIVAPKNIYQAASQVSNKNLNSNIKSSITISNTTNTTKASSTNSSAKMIPKQLFQDSMGYNDIDYEKVIMEFQKSYLCFNGQTSKKPSPPKLKKRNSS